MICSKLMMRFLGFTKHQAVNTFFYHHHGYLVNIISVGSLMIVLQHPVNSHVLRPNQPNSAPNQGRLQDLLLGALMGFGCQVLSLECLFWKKR